MYKRTKIGATIGPASEKYATLLAMVKAGMNFARLNFSHGNHHSHAELIKKIRRVERAVGEPVAILQDLQGPKIRVGALPEAGLSVKVGGRMVFDSALSAYKGGDVPLICPGVEKELKKGERVLIDDGRLEFRVLAVSGSRLRCEAQDRGVIFSKKGVNFPDSRLTMPALNEKDKADLRFGLKAGVDVVSLSFVHRAQDIIALRALIKKIEKEEGLKPEQPVSVIAKIEKRQGVENIAGILAEADGIMVARGDLGLEMAAAEVPLVQKRLIDLANAAAKQVIVATQMLDSMRHSRRPTRAEVSDVANAVIDHADALLLTNETAVGEYPVLVVRAMAETITAVEASKYDDLKLVCPSEKQETPIGRAVAELSRLMAEEVGAKLILAASISGETGRLISRARPELPIMVATSTERAWRQLNMSWGVRPFVLLPCASVEELVRRSIQYIKKHKIAKKGDKMIIVAGEPVGHAGNVNLVEAKVIT